jgi:hypothetical protein
MASDSVPVAKIILEKARIVHKDWCAKIFAAYLPSKRSPHYTVRLHAFIAATEFYLWKLLRRDIGLGPEETLRVFEDMIEGLICNYELKKEKNEIT